MIDKPIGGAAFNNEFGRPNLCGHTFVPLKQILPVSATLSQAHYDRRWLWQYS